MDELVCTVEPAINRFPVRRSSGLARSQDLERRKDSARDALLMTLKHLATKSETIYFHLQFEAAHASHIDHVESGMSAIIYSLFSRKLSRVK